MIDYHCHILPGLDDGAASAEESLAMAAVLSGAGYTHICCTPHRLRGMYDTTGQTMRQSMDALQALLAEDGINLTLLPGMEYCLDEFFIEDFSADPVPLGAGRQVLVETPSNADPQLLRENIFHLVRTGYVPLFAHPERHAFLAPPTRTKSMFSRIGSWNRGGTGDDSDTLSGTLLDELKMMGCLFQGNLGSVGGYYGSLVRQQENRLRQEGLYTCFGTDGHNMKSLNQFLGTALNEVRESHADLLANRFDLIAS